MTVDTIEQGGGRSEVSFFFSFALVGLVLLVRTVLEGFWVGVVVEVEDTFGWGGDADADGLEGDDVDDAFVDERLPI